MNNFRESRCSISAVLLLFLLQGSRAADVHVHKAVGDSLDLIADYPKEGLVEVRWIYSGKDFAVYEKDQIKPLNPPLFQKRLKLYKDNISITLLDLKLQDSGRFTIVAEGKSVQHPTKVFVLHVHDLIRDVQIEVSNSWRESKNMCVFHLRCVSSGDLNPSYSWSGDLVRSGQNQNISLHPAESATVSCTANNTVSIKSTNQTVVCTGKGTSVPSGFDLKYLLIAVGAGVVVVVILGASLAVFCKRRRRTGQDESRDGITVYEDVNTDGVAKKRPESVKGMSIYETVDDLKVTQNMPQTLYDKINFQRHPAAGAGAQTSSSYQEVL
ncbi:SLAM family member 5 isoform X2 [Pimephales promelas]|uniref:SLAM family member 5 isoform X2 n=1 Tax=Pimephales promelas TaxID=90988 RepID=UPI001955A9F0|nr:SLAM family member 5 isoform X2 [Pimephales promelas]